ncbi:MAG TPA: DUF87 domain-containing protein [Abditibacteriaceae bacterium]|jgi:hypothetical protein
MSFIGVITRGSLEKGVEMKLHPDENIEEIKSGTFVIIEGRENDFFSMITDVTLDASNPDILLNPPRDEEKLLMRVLQQSAIYTTVRLKPMLMVPRGADVTLHDDDDDLLVNDSFAMNGVRSKTIAPSSKDGEPGPVKTVPSHFSRVRRASEDDVSRVFGQESEKNSDWFNVGTPLDMQTPVCVDLKKFAERSNGVFGKSGTGKSFLTRTILCGLIHHRKDVVNLIFDAHNEYGWEARSEEGNAAKGLCQIFGKNRVKIYSLDPASSRTRGVGHVEEVRIPLSSITPEDVLGMQEELNLADAAAESAYLVRNVYKDQWLSILLGIADAKLEEDQSLAQRVRANDASLSALQRKLQSRLMRNGELLPYLTEKPLGQDILKTLLHDIERGVHIVLEFGGQQNLLTYLLVANVLTRRIHSDYVSKYEKWIGAGMKKHDEPRHLMITIEEAHKFLNPRAARQTIFGDIARELRKYGVTLLVVDQRPSGIDDEVLSQIGTRITAQLNDEADIAAVLTGVNGASGLKGVMAQLDSKQQALVMGHSVPMPVMIQTRNYDATLWGPMGSDEDTPEGRARILELANDF